MYVSKLVRLVALVALCTMIATSCSGGSGANSTTTAATGSGAPDIEFTDGVLPESLPGDFPIPAQAVVGSGMVNRTAGTTELIIRIPASVEAVAKFFDDNFAARGYDVISSEANGASGWAITFEKDGLSGTIELSPVGIDISQAVLRAEA